MAESLESIRFANQYVRRGMQEGWLRGDDADQAVTKVEDMLRDRLDADIARCQRARAISAANPSLTIFQAWAAAALGVGEEAPK